MATPSQTINFFGHWHEQNRLTIPEQPGIFCVHAGIHNQEAKTISVRKLIYIGESDNVCQRITRHERHQEWLKHLKKGETLCFSFAPVEYHRAQVTTALIFGHKPPENIEHLCPFPFQQTNIRLTGTIDLLQENFTIYENSLQMLTKQFIRSLRGCIDTKTIATAKQTRHAA